MEAIFSKRKKRTKMGPKRKYRKNSEDIVLLYLKLRDSRNENGCFLPEFPNSFLASWQVRTCYFQGWIHGFHKKFREVDLLRFTTSSWAQNKISYIPWEWDFWNLQDSILFATANSITPKSIWRTPRIIAAVGFLALIWKRSGNWEARKSQ